MTDRGRPVALLVPIPEDPFERLVLSGLVIVPSESAADVTARVPRRASVDVSEALRQLRSDER